MELSWLTDKDLPQTEAGGKISPLHLPKDRHLHYPTHMVVFDRGILGFESWRPGPGASVLAEYLNERGFPGKLSFEFLYKLDTLAELERIGEFRSLRIRIPAAYSEVIARADVSLGKTLEILGHIGEGVDVDIRIGPTEKRGPLLGLRQLVGHLRRITKEDGAQKLEVVGYDSETGERVTIDLLNARMMQKREMVLLGSTSKAVEAESAYQAIERTFSQQRGALYDSAGTDPG